MHSAVKQQRQASLEEKEGLKYIFAPLKSLFLDICLSYKNLTNTCVESQKVELIETERNVGYQRLGWVGGWENADQRTLFQLEDIQG